MMIMTNADDNNNDHGGVACKQNTNAAMQHNDKRNNAVPHQQCNNATTVLRVHKLQRERHMHNRVT